jgi:hypothetical protein
MSMEQWWNGDGLGKPQKLGEALEYHESLTKTPGPQHKVQQLEANGQRTQL